MPPYEKVEMSQTLIVRKKGHDVISDPLYNKGTAFPHAERERLGLRGLLPPRILALKEQERKVLQDYREGHDYVSPEEVENWSISRCADGLLTARTLSHLSFSPQLAGTFGGVRRHEICDGEAPR